jgi:hypothetical protein
MPYPAPAVGQPYRQFRDADAGQDPVAEGCRSLADLYP